jgi:hypothetical protein
MTVHVSGPNVLLVAGNSHNLVFISSARTEFTVDLYPVLSMSKVSPCFADILFPIEVWPYLLFIYSLAQSHAFVVLLRQILVEWQIFISQ